MRKFLPFIALSLAILVGAVIFIFEARLPSQEPITAKLVSTGDLPTGFQRADGTLPITFPQDYGAHPEYQTEWWYYTGNLTDSRGQHFGYQLTFFRRALIPATERTTRTSNWSSGQIYMAHFALTDTAGKQHYAYERFSRGVPELAGATSDPFSVWLEDWQVVQTSSDRYRLQARQDRLEINLELSDIKGPVLHGNKGYSQKGPDPGNASYYFSQTRLETIGSIRINENSFQVSGLSWMDHEFSTSALSAGQVGWDWFSIQLDNDFELMVFQIRREDGSIDPYSSGTLVNPDGSTEILANDAFEINVLDRWKSPRSGAEYPIRWNVSVPGKNILLEIQPHMVDQEMNVSFTYWEGAVQVQGKMQGAEVEGNGFIEMTGYTGSMEGQF
jgi:predicted secreted hydrolase